MKKALLLLSCETSHESPWFITRGSEHCIKVRGLSDQDSIALITDTGEANVHQSLERGVNPLKELGKRYKIAKIANARPPVPTTVEIYFD